jgi:hypothetical protein
MNTASIKAEVARKTLKREAAEDMYTALERLIRLAKLTPGAGMSAAIRAAENAMAKARGEAA